jgi:hypothetical protein
MLLHMDDFSGYGNISLLLAGVYSRVGATNVPGYDGVALTADPDGVSPGQVLQMSAAYGGGGNYATVRKPLAIGTTNFVGITQRIWCAALPHIALNFRPIQLLDGSNNRIAYINVTATGILEVRKGSDNSVLATSTVPVITAQGWWHIEAQFFINGASSTAEVRVEGIPKIEATDIDMGSTAVAQVEIANDPDATSAGDTYYIKDYVIYDDTGTEVNDWIGTSILHAHTLTADVALNWSLSTGSDGYSILNNVPPQVGEYIYAGNDPIPGAYKAAISPLPDDIVSVKGALVRYMVAKNDGGDAKVQSGIISDPEGTADTSLGTERPSTIAQTFYDDYYEVDPKTGQPFLPEDFNNINVEFDRTL